MKLGASKVALENNEVAHAISAEEVALLSKKLFHPDPCEVLLEQIQKHAHLLFSPDHNPDFRRWWEGFNPSQARLVCKVIQDNASQAWSNDLFLEYLPSLPQALQDIVPYPFYGSDFLRQSNSSLFVSVLNLNSSARVDLAYSAVREKLSEKIELIPKKVWQELWNRDLIEVFFHLPDDKLKQVMSELKIKNIREHLHKIFLHGARMPEKLKCMLGCCQGHELSFEDSFYYLRRCGVGILTDEAMKALLDTGTEDDFKKLGAFYRRLGDRVQEKKDKIWVNHPSVERALITQVVDFNEKVHSSKRKM